MADDAPRYRFGPRSTRGLIAGWHGGQVAVIAVAALLALGILRSVGGAAGVVLAVVVAGAGIAAATWPIAGRPAEAWLPTVARYGAAALADGRTPWSSSRRRGPVSRLSLRPLVPALGRPIAAVEDAERGAWTVVVQVGGLGFALLDDKAQAEAVAAWSGALAALAGEWRSLHRLQWIARSYPAAIDPAATGALQRDAVAPISRISRPRPRHVSSPVADYEQMIDEVAAKLWARDVLVAVTIEAPIRSLRARARSAEHEHAAVLRIEDLVSSLRSRLSGAGLVAGEPLDEASLAAAVRRSYEAVPSVAILPSAAPGASAAPGPSAARGPSAAPGASAAFPIGVEEHWAHLRTDATWQAAYWVSEWPRGEVGPGVLLPLLLNGRARMSVSLTFAPLPPARAVRLAEHERTSGAADAELRKRHGFAVTARSWREQESRAQRESELAEGHAAYLFSGYVAVTGGDEASLERACLEVEQAASLAQLELRRLYGSQEEGWCCTLPLGRGCR